MKSLYTLVFAILLLGNSAYAIQDSNGNGMSDVWEKFYNSGNLFSTSDPALAPTADFDGDGWSNEKEALAGTSPFSSVLPAGWVQTAITQNPSSAGLFTLSFPSINGKNYRLSASTDLVEWFDYPDLMAGTGSDIVIAVNSSETTGAIPTSLFWRVKIADEDTDRDSLTDWEESKLGTLVNNPDSDDDGIPDNLDTLPLQNTFLLNPDGDGLATSFDTGLIGRWDFESIVPSSTPNDFAYGLNRFLDSTTNARHAGTFEVGLDPLGMPSKAATAPSRGFLGIPPSLLNNRAVYSVSLWAKLPSDAISSDSNHQNSAGIFSNHDYVPYGSSTTYGKQSLNALWIANSGSNEIIRAGGYYWSNYKIVSGSPVPASPIIYNFSGIEIVRPKGTFTDDKWHHYLYVCNDAVTTLYIDGVLMGTSNHVPADITVNGANAAVSVGRLFGKALGTTPFQVTTTGGVLKGSIDRLRVWSRALGLSDSQALFHQDISGDGLWDLTSVNSRLWRDSDSSGSPSASEYSFINSPFKYYPPTSDTDGDGATDLQEQAAQTYAGFADSDGDLLPDGWEIAHGLDPLDATGVNGANGNADGDAYNNLEEYRYNTDPHNAASGGAPSIPTNEQIVIKLGVGDRSGSHSEDYVLNCFEIDPTTGAENRVYTLRSGGFGQYTEENHTFRKGRTYTFQLDWQGSNLQSRSASSGVSSEGPDYDYHMVVEPVGTAATGTVILDGYDPRTGKVDPSIKILDPEDVNASDDDDDDVADLPNKLEPLRVVYLSFDMISVASDQIVDNRANKLPTGSYGGEPNNPMLMATRTGDDGRISVEVSVPPTFADQILVGVRRVGAPAILGYAKAVAPPGFTKVKFSVWTAEAATSVSAKYEIVGGYDANSNGVLDNSEATIVFEKTPRTDANGDPYSGSDTTFAGLDKFRIIPVDEFIAARDQVRSWGLLPGTDQAGDLLVAFANGSTVCEDTTTSSGYSISSSTAGLTHPLGGKWNLSNQDTTHKFTFPNTSWCAIDVRNSTALELITDSICSAHKAELLASATNEFQSSAWYPFSYSVDFIATEAPPEIFGYPLGINELGLSFGKVTISGQAKILYKKQDASHILVNSVEVNGSFDDIYDFAFGSGEKPRTAAKVQAGHATLSTIALPSGKVFYTRVEFTGDILKSENF